MPTEEEARRAGTQCASVFILYTAVHVHGLLSQARPRPVKFLFFFPWALADEQLITRGRRVQRPATTILTCAKQAQIVLHPNFIPFRVSFSQELGDGLGYIII